MTARRAPDASAARFQGSARPTGPGRAVATTRGEASRGPDGADGRVKRNRDSGGRRGEGAGRARRARGEEGGARFSGRRDGAPRPPRGSAGDTTRCRAAGRTRAPRSAASDADSEQPGPQTGPSTRSQRPAERREPRRLQEAGTVSGGNEERTRRAGPGAAVCTAPRAREPGKAPYGAVAASGGQRRCRHEPCVMTRRQVNVRDFT